MILISTTCSVVFTCLVAAKITIREKGQSQHEMEEEEEK